MLRVGLTGELGSGKSTVLRIFGELGAVTMSSDEMGRAMMQPGEQVYDAIVAQFGPSVVLPDGQLDRPALARLAFDPERPRVEELNAIVHPAVIAEQERLIAEVAREMPDAIVVIESALIFTTKHGGEQPWRKRFDCIVVVTAPDEVKVERFVARSGVPVDQGRQEALRRLAAQRVAIPTDTRVFRVANETTVEDLRHDVEAVYRQLNEM